MLGLQCDIEDDPEEVAEDAPDEEDPPGAKHTGKAKAKPKATPRPRGRERFETTKIGNMCKHSFQRQTSTKTSPSVNSATLFTEPCSVWPLRRAALTPWSKCG